ncbi:MAG: hypothetical protein D6698_14430 [Gammaproteobacteria bacterium]|nr:MAG: hypothetical protein D6698_14430 [Gammaproteobacteria bacterium]
MTNQELVLTFITAMLMKCAIREGFTILTARRQAALTILPVTLMLPAVTLRLAAVREQHAVHLLLEEQAVPRATRTLIA